MKKTIIIFLTLLLISCGETRVMTLVEMPQDWSDKTGQAFLNKVDMRKIQYSVLKQFPESVQKQININIMPLIFKPAGDKDRFYKYEVTVNTHQEWDKTKQVEKYIAHYLEQLLEQPDAMKPMVFVPLPKGYSVQDSQQVLYKLDMSQLKLGLAKNFPGIENRPLHMKIVPIEFKPKNLKYHVMVVSESDHEFEYAVEQYIAQFLKKGLKVS
ncbi:hypothetical protein [Shewanella violacea]|uniref:Lipoprotein n=1 Tax=Shewanella violacea (strain JCM 10179 / CIP 106290 / LMG 19151 / DSS12) TaxID=637905 RepID=D4ZB42_SHEVD|nr:hypothetical protein [Shewanella violacea]BAJ03237.1 hypothetical protein SVI_3266 [Shewanella violacea DSS12]